MSRPKQSSAFFSLLTTPHLTPTAHLSQAAHVTAVFDAQRAVVATAAACAKPSGGVSSPVFAGILGPLQTALGAVTELREKNRADKAFFNHLSTVSEGIPASGWVAVVSIAQGPEDDRAVPGLLCPLGQRMLVCAALLHWEIAIVCFGEELRGRTRSRQGKGEDVN